MIGDAGNFQNGHHFIAFTLTPADDYTGDPTTDRFKIVVNKEDSALLVPDVVRFFSGGTITSITYSYAVEGASFVDVHHYISGSHDMADTPIDAFTAVLSPSCPSSYTGDPVKFDHNDNPYLGHLSLFDPNTIVQVTRKVFYGFTTAPNFFLVSPIIVE